MKTLKTDINRYTDSYGTNVIHYIIIAIIGLIFGVLIGYSSFSAISIAISLSIAIIIIFTNSPIQCLTFLIIAVPFASSIYLRVNFLDISGVKPVELLTLVLIVISLLNYSKSVKMPKFMCYYSFAIIFIFTVSIIRSLQYLHIFNELFYTKDKLSSTRYVLSHFVKPLISFLPMIIIVKYAKNRKDLKLINNTMVLALILLSFQVIYLYFNALKQHIPKGVSFDLYYMNYLGMHRNNIATFFIIGLPIAFSNYFLNKNIRSILFIFLILAGIGFNFSRAAYFTSLFAMFIYLAISKRTKLLPVVVFISIIISLFFLPDIIKNRAAVGLKSENPDKITAGRVDHIWVPLMEEYYNGGKSVIYGKGRYAIQSSDAVKNGKILKVAHPHNMYLEIFLDAGIIGFIVFITFYYGIIRKFFSSLHRTSDPVITEYLYAYIVSIICFLISGFVDRSFFPTYDNMYIWIVLGCTFVLYTRMIDIEQQSKIEI